MARCRSGGDRCPWRRRAESNRRTGLCRPYQWAPTRVAGCIWPAIGLSAETVCTDVQPSVAVSVQISVPCWGPTRADRTPLCLDGVGIAQPHTGASDNPRRSPTRSKRDTSTQLVASETTAPITKATPGSIMEPWPLRGRTVADQASRLTAVHVFVPEGDVRRPSGMPMTVGPLTLGTPPERLASRANRVQHGDTVVPWTTDRPPTVLSMLYQEHPATFEAWPDWAHWSTTCACSWSWSTLGVAAAFAQALALGIDVGGLCHLQSRMHHRAR